MIPKLTGNLLRAGRALAGLTRDDLAARTGLSRDVLRSWEISSEAIVPAATYSHLCRVVAVLAGESARFSGDGVSALSGDSPDYLLEAVPPPSTPNDSKGLHLGMDLAARVRHAGICHASMSRSPNLRGFYNGSPLGCQVTSTSAASQHAER
jgi:transcriptional regulator with XRE-family HTH domain